LSSALLGQLTRPADSPVGRRPLLEQVCRCRICRHEIVVQLA